MRELKQTLIAILLVAAIVAVICGTLVLRDARVTVVKLNTALDSVHATVQHVDAALSGPHGLDATLQNANAILVQAGLAADETRRASGEQREQWRKTGVEVTGAVRDIRAEIADLRIVTMNANSAIVSGAQDVHTALAPVAPLLNTTAGLLSDVDTNLARNEDLTRFLRSMADTSANAAGITANLNTMSMDLAGSLHKSLHPSKTHLVFGGLWTGAKVVLTHFP